MAVISKKDKLIEEAQKLVVRGQFDKAAKAYEQILVLDPSAINLRQKRAELLIKSGRLEDARKEHETIGKHFTKNGFYLKAIAVYKQLQKLFPGDISLSITLAELNEKHGLVANALSEYKTIYEFHEKAGNIPEMLGILNRMQNVDPQNIAIKIKLAEAYNQHGKQNEAFSVFAKAVTLLLERGDSATLPKISARIQQLFPQKPDFMFDILAEQINHGNAKSAINGIQSLLRSNPQNKRAWDLVTQAYILLEQPHQLKKAYQHYLNFFPTEPAAMHGLISSVTAEQNLAGALVLLDTYEATLISAGFLQQLEKIYHSLDRLDPINVRVLEGLIRVATAIGNKTEIQSLTSKLQSLRSVARNGHLVAGEPESAHVFIDSTPLNAPEAAELFSFDDDDSEQATIPGFEAPNATCFPESVTTAEQLQEATDSNHQTEEDIEIEVEFDVDSDTQDVSETLRKNSWLDSVDSLFNTIDTAPSGVKFADEMEVSDVQMHFDLGQAFKEMGLYDEAINEFRHAGQDVSRRIECLILQCACLRERGELEKSITMLQALLKPGLSEEARCAVKYELATGYETAGNSEKAHVLITEIHTSNPDFRDIKNRIHNANNLESLDFSDDDLKDF